ncbi:MAG: iron-containing alcohol dehydrogenase [Endomicrobiia bacterium]
MNFVLSLPTKIIFGENTTDEVAKYTKKFSDNILLVIGKESAKKSGLFDKVIKLLSYENIKYEVLEGIKSNPTVDMVRVGIDVIRQKNIDFILAVGGGSVIDTAKTIACGVFYDGDVWDFFIKKAHIKKALPLGVVLTLAAAGSEMNGNAVISNNDTQQKLAISSNLLYPKFSILDPINTLTVPLNHTLYGVVDILSHVFEQYFDKTPINESILQDRFAEAIMKTTIETAYKLKDDLKNVNYRKIIMWCSTMALNGIVGCGKFQDWASHQIEHAISAVYDIPHGLGLAIVFPAWMKYVAEEIPERFYNFGKNVWGIINKSTIDTVLEGINCLENFYKELGIPTKLSEIKITDEKFDVLASKAVEFGPIGNVKKLKKEDVIKILKLCL